MQYFYAILWFAIGLILIFSISKENKIFYFAGGFLDVYKRQGQGREKGKRKNRKAEHLISFEKETFAFPAIYCIFLL